MTLDHEVLERTFWFLATHGEGWDDQCSGCASPRYRDRRVEPERERCGQEKEEEKRKCTSSVVHEKQEDETFLQSE